MTLQQLTYFLAAAEHGSFTAAAEELRLARPSVSEQIANLEAELGVALFVRAGRRPAADRRRAAAAPRGGADARGGGRGGRGRPPGADAARRTASLGTFSTAHHLLLPDLVE